MKPRTFLFPLSSITMFVFALLVTALTAGSALAAADIPAYMDVIAAGEPPAPSETARGPCWR